MNSGTIPFGPQQKGTSLFLANTEPLWKNKWPRSLLWYTHMSMCTYVYIVTYVYITMHHSSLGWTIPEDKPVHLDANPKYEPSTRYIGTNHCAPSCRDYIMLPLLIYHVDITCSIKTTNQRCEPLRQFHPPRLRCRFGDWREAVILLRCLSKSFILARLSIIKYNEVWWLRFLV